MAQPPRRPPRLPDLPDNPTFQELLEAHFRLITMFAEVHSWEWGRFDEADRQAYRVMWAKAKLPGNVLPEDATQVSTETNLKALLDAYMMGWEAYDEMCSLYVKSWENV